MNAKTPLLISTLFLSVIVALSSLSRFNAMQHPAAIFDHAAKATFAVAIICKGLTLGRIYLTKNRAGRVTMLQEGVEGELEGLASALVSQRMDKGWLSTPALSV